MTDSSYDPQASTPLQQTYIPPGVVGDTSSHHQPPADKHLDQQLQLTQQAQPSTHPELLSQQVPEENQWPPPQQGQPPTHPELLSQQGSDKGQWPPPQQGHLQRQGYLPVEQGQQVPPMQGQTPPYPLHDKLPQQQHGQLPSHSESPPQNIPSEIVVKQQPTVIATPHLVFRERSITFTDKDGKQVRTVLEYKIGGLTLIIAGVICLSGFICILGFCCAIIPFLIDGTKDVYHINPNDGSVVGVYRRMGC